MLNQFSMDEYDNTFRITTTTGDNWRTSDSSTNHLWVLNEKLELIGSVEDLAPSERIYSTRFMGERAYMVTFRQTDPLYVIDLSNPDNPEVLGYLKVTGFSTYLHPYDQDHIIGIGKEATETGRALGVKITIFDVTDVNNPIERAKYEITDAKWSDSTALYEHKAFLFDKEKNLLSIPISYTYETNTKDTLGYNRYKSWNGVYVFDITKDEIKLKGKIDHENQNLNEEDDYYYNNWRSRIQRSLFMDDVLYTVSELMVKANNLDYLDEIKYIDLPYDEEDFRKYYVGEDVMTVWILKISHQNNILL